jgi:hypothetical protein
VFVAFFTLLLAGGFAAWLVGRPSDDISQSASATAVTSERFALVEVGMEPPEVTELLGPPDRETTSLAEGLAWPEPEDTCWYYRLDGSAREYQVCFVHDAVITRGSYLVPEEG